MLDKHVLHELYVYVLLASQFFHFFGVPIFLAYLAWSALKEFRKFNASSKQLEDLP